MIVLNRTQYQQILRYSLEELPNEACGLLGGRVEEDKKIVEKVYLLTNTDNSPEHFSMDTKEQFAAVKEMRANGWTMLGNFHSHPESPSRPSEEDKRLAFDPNVSYLILSLADRENIVLKSFRIKDSEVDEEEIIFEGE